MVIVTPTETHSYYMDKTHQQNLDVAKKHIKKDWDMVFVYDGYEGSGKSVKCQQDALYCDPTLNLSRIVFNPDDFKEAIDTSKQYQAIIYDEAYGGLSSKSAMSTVNQAIVQKLTVIREKNLFIFIVLPTFFDLDKYVALWRSRALVHVYSGDEFRRGFFKFYNIDLKKQLYVNGKKFYNYAGVKPNYMGRFTNYYTVSEKAYRKKKRETSVSIQKEDEDKILHILIQIAKILYAPPHNMSIKEISEIIPRHKRTITRYLAIDKDKDKTIYTLKIKSGKNGY